MSIKPDRRARRKTRRDGAEVRVREYPLRPPRRGRRVRPYAVRLECGHEHRSDRATRPGAHRRCYDCGLRGEVAAMRTKETR